MNIVLWILQVLLAGIYGMAGFMKGITTRKARERMPWAKDSTETKVKFVGIMEILGALGMLLPMIFNIFPWLTPLAAIGLALVQVLAMLTVHIPRKEFKSLPMNVVLMLLALFVAIGRWSLFA
jgi:uncharacterized membrane protein